MAAGRATADGRPLIWKTRDYSSEPDNEVKYNSSFQYKFVSVNNDASSYAYMGVNDQGFAIMNAVSDDLPSSDGPGSLGAGQLMRDALGNCATVAEFEQYLLSTNSSGRSGKSNFGTIDATGAAVIFEASYSDFWKFDAADTDISPNGYLIRTNHSVTGGGSSGIERFRRSTALVNDFFQGDTLNHRSILRHQMRDFSDANSNPVSVPFAGNWNLSSPYGYIYNYLSICRSTSVSAMVVQGVLPQAEPTWLSTMWVLLGQPATTIAVPYWPVGTTPTIADGPVTAQLCDVARSINSHLVDSGSSYYVDSYKLLDGSGSGLWTVTHPAEDLVLHRTDSLLTLWRVTAPTASEMLSWENEFADFALERLEAGLALLEGQNGVEEYQALPQTVYLEQNYPNPFNASTVIPFWQDYAGPVRITIHDIQGRQVAALADQEYPAGQYHLVWDAATLPSGLYFCTIRAVKSNGALFLSTRKLTLLK
ncbi:MAG: T9SS type A sorting domain-containing protein [Candidatus Neomarinimicrobiota bacterium]